MAVEFLGDKAGIKQAVIDNRVPCSGRLRQVKEDKKLVISAAGAA